MTLARFVVSSVHVSATFTMMAYVIFVTPVDRPPNGITQTHGLLYLAMLPYFLGALINKEGYWERSESESELLYPSERKKKWRALYLYSDFLDDFLGWGGKVSRSDEKNLEGCLRTLEVRTKLDRADSDYKRLRGAHLSKTIDKLLQEFPGISFLDAPYPGGYFLQRDNKFMLRTSLVDFYRHLRGTLDPRY